MKQVSISEMKEILLNDATRHRKGFFHYTTWSVFKNLAHIIDNGDAKGKRLLWLSDSSRLNDDYENHISRDTFLTSFSYGQEESVPMWTNYGWPKSEVVRLRVPHKAMLKWYESVKREGLAVYQIVEGKDTQYYKLPEVVVDVELCDVGYRDSIANERNRDYMEITHNSQKFCIPGLHYRAIADDDETHIGTFIKKQGWNYEREVRLVVRLIKPCQTIHKIAIDFTGPITAVLSDPYNNITRSPWFSHGKKYESVEGVCIEQLMGSRYQGELNFSGPCGKCKIESKDGCACEYQEYGATWFHRTESLLHSLEKLKRSVFSVAQNIESKRSMFVWTIVSEINEVVSDAQRSAEDQNHPFVAALASLTEVRDVMIEWLVCEITKGFDKGVIANVLFTYVLRTQDLEMAQEDRADFEDTIRALLVFEVLWFLVIRMPNCAHAVEVSEEYRQVFEACLKRADEYWQAEHRVVKTDISSSVWMHAYNGISPSDAYPIREELVRTFGDEIFALLVGDCE